MAKVINYHFEKVVKKTANQIKKHYTQFTDSEKQILKTCIDTVPQNEIRILNHAKNHLNFLNLNIVKQVLEDYNIIEFNVNFKADTTECRVLIRSNKVLTIKENGTTAKANVCIVMNIKTGEVITAYANYTNDKHDNINMNRYNANISVLQYAII